VSRSPLTVKSEELAPFSGQVDVNLIALPSTVKEPTALREFGCSMVPAAPVTRVVKVWLICRKEPSAVNSKKPLPTRVEASMSTKLARFLGR
jgi:hypothetical protein